MLGQHREPLHRRILRALERFSRDCKEDAAEILMHHTVQVRAWPEAGDYVMGSESRRSSPPEWRDIPALASGHLPQGIPNGFSQGGPGTATSLLTYQVYRVAFNGLYFGYASSVAVFGFLIVLVISLVGFAFLRRSMQSI